MKGKQEEKQLYLIKSLLDEMPQYKNISIPGDASGQWRLLRSLFNVRPPYPASSEFLRIQDEFLSEKIRVRGIIDCKLLVPASADPRIYLWQGDITTLRCDAIVNAANSTLLGCWQPCHSCIDNLIHTLSGVQLRMKCKEMMQIQGHEEETGTAKITPGYNLSCKYILHTVGPIISNIVTKKDCELLASCYRSCLETAVANRVQSIAFCCISTGVFRFPQEQAAKIAIDTVSRFLETDPSICQVIFNVFTDEDFAIYQRLLDVP